MNRLNIADTVNLGGHKMSLNDLNTLQLSVFDVAQALAFMMGQGGTNIILSQLLIDDRVNDFDVELPAVVFYTGKLYEVPAAFSQAKSAGGAYKFRIDTAVDPDNPVTYQDGSSFNVHINETMTLVHTTQTGANYIPLSSFNSFNGWNEVEPSTTNLDTGDPGDEKTLRYRIIGNTMFFTLHLIGTVSANGAVSVTFPWTIKSAADQNVVAVGTRNGSIQNYLGSLPDGQSGISFSIITTTFSASDEIELVCHGTIQIKY